MDTTISRQLVADDQRTNITADLFGVYFPLQLELFVYAITSKLSEDYSGGYWHFYQLGNGGFYMAPDSDGKFQVVSENGHECFMSGDALGITACLYAYSHLSFGQGEFADICEAAVCSRRRNVTQASNDHEFPLRIETALMVNSLGHGLRKLAGAGGAAARPVG